MSRNTILVNNYYPISYFANANIEQFDNPTPESFWASDEKLAPAQDYLIFDFGAIRPINLVDFEISQKPVDIIIQYDDGSVPNTQTWVTVTQDSGFEESLSIGYVPSVSNPWHYFENHFGLVQTRYIKIIFTRRTDAFPLTTSDPIPFSIEVRNLRLMHTISESMDFVQDTGKDILGNTYRTEMEQYDSINVLDSDLTSVWQSQPNPSQFAVEALYFDIREDGIYPVVVDEVYIDPVTMGPIMHIYYSNDDDEPDWDNKLWVPINRHYVLTRGFQALPRPVLCKYMKLEFSNLSPTPYNSIDYPTLKPITYRQYPTWVQNFFLGGGTAFADTSRFINPVDIVQFEPLEMGFVTEPNRLNTSFNDVRTPSIQESDDEIRAFIEALNQTQANTQDDSRTQVESQINLFSSFAFGQNLLSQLDSSRALSRFAAQDITDFNAETAVPILPAPTVQSTNDLTAATEEKIRPIMWFFQKCRHTYQVLKSNRPSKVAYTVSIREVGFFRRDFTTPNDEIFYIETGQDDIHTEINEFTQEDWRYVVNP